MDRKPNSPRVLVDHLDREFSRLVSDLKKLVSSLSPDLLYRPLPGNVTIGESLLRSAAAVEQAFGGLTANLWDDPFEWTLPETLSTTDRLLEYLSEVDAVRQRAFTSIASDEELAKYVSVPSGEEQPLFALLLETLVKANEHYGRALAARKMLSGETA
jgi:hypothetical protein